MPRPTRIALVLLSFLALAGCGNKNVQFGGKVTLPDDTPFTRGFVCFTNGTIAAYGPLQADGSYAMGSLKPGDGLPPGTYQVYLSGFQEVISPEDAEVTVYRSPIDMKYDSPDTSGLACEVVKGGRYDFVVEPFK